MSITRCPECNKVISTRFPMHDCAPQKCDGCGKATSTFVEIDGSLLCPGCLPEKGGLWNGMALEDIFSACEKNKPLRAATDEELRVALGLSLREIHRHHIQQELDYRIRWNRKHNKGTVKDPTFFKNGGPSKGKCPTKAALK